MNSTEHSALRNQWLSTAELAAELKKSDRRIRYMCIDGTLMAFGFRIFRDSNRNWWIRRPVVPRNRTY